MSKSMLNCFWLFTFVYLGTPGSAAGPNANQVANHENWKLLPTEFCGFGRNNGKITGGESAFNGQYPWMTLLGYQRKKGIKFQCGATLLNEWYIITAAHCVSGLEDKLKVVRLGAHFSPEFDENTKEYDSPIQDMAIAQVILHPEYNQSNSKHDIALIRLDQPVNYDVFVRPICLPRGEILTKNFAAQKVTVAGWGVMDSSSEVRSKTLYHVDIPMRDRCACDNAYSPITLDESQFCAGTETGEDTCNGDSGGPMMWWKYTDYFKQYYLLGVISFGKAYCGEAPSVYTNVVYHLKWILDNLVQDIKTNAI